MANAKETPWELEVEKIREVRRSFYYRPSPKYPRVESTVRTGRCKVYTREEIAAYQLQMEVKNEC